LFVASVSDPSRLAHTLLRLDWASATLGGCLDCATRWSLSSAGMRHAMRRRGRPRLRQLVADIQAHLNDAAGYFSANWAFHRRMAMVCDNAALQRVYLAIVAFLEIGFEDSRPAARCRRTSISTSWSRQPSRSTRSSSRVDRAVRRHEDSSPLRAPDSTEASRR
jgi:DNA-binding GntR family transcriptional regulator